MKKIWLLIGLVVCFIGGSIYWYVSYHIGQEEKRLEEPVIAGVNTGYIMSWKSVPHADIYYVYVNDELVSEQAETTLTLEDIHPMNFYWLKVEAVDLDEDYESSISFTLFSPFAYATLNDVEAQDDDIFYMGYEQTTFANKYGLATFRFESPVYTGYLVKVYVDDVLYEETITIRTNEETIMVPFNPIEQGFSVPLSAMDTTIFYVYTFEPGQKIDIKIEFLDLLDLSHQHEITVGPNQTVQFPIVEPSDAYLLEVDRTSDEVDVTLFHTIYRYEYILSTDGLIFKSALKRDMQIIEIENQTDSAQIVRLSPVIYDDVVNQESIEIDETQNEQYILLSGFEIFGYIFNLDFQKLKTDFDVEVYVVNRYEGLIKVDTPLEHIEGNLYRNRISLETFSDVAILIVIKNQSSIDDLLEPSTFVGYIA